ncbi:hypothetical protein [Bacillus ndiopicus]|uniref:hypothetical protein n=1 Tax=Bacillus ndiopicus TaxID=1347368 RepID=UPI0005A6A40E|nr:hypothetical protein [Bacillus ndiopicus]
MSSYNFRLDTSNKYDSEEKYNERNTQIEEAWKAFTGYFLEKGSKVAFKYWTEDTIYGDKRYSSCGIKAFLNSSEEHHIHTDCDNLTILTMKKQMI